MASRFVHKFFPFLISNPTQGEKWMHIDWTHFIRVVDVKMGFVTYTRTDLPFQANQVKSLNEFKEDYKRIQ